MYSDTHTKLIFNKVKKESLVFYSHNENGNSSYLTLNIY